MPKTRRDIQHLKKGDFKKMVAECIFVAEHEFMIDDICCIYRKNFPPGRKRDLIGSCVSAIAKTGAIQSVGKSGKKSIYRVMDRNKLEKIADGKESHYTPYVRSPAPKPVQTRKGLRIRQRDFNIFILGLLSGLFLLSVGMLIGGIFK